MWLSEVRFLSIQRTYSNAYARMCRGKFLSMSKKFFFQLRAPISGPEALIERIARRRVAHIPHTGCTLPDRRVHLLARRPRPNFPV